MIPFLRVGDIMHCTIFFFPLLPKCVLALYTALKQYNLQVALCVVNIFAIKNAVSGYWVGGKEKNHLVYNSTL